MKHNKGIFNAVWSDMATEHHMKEIKRPGGVKNVTRNEPALIRWSLIRHLTGVFASQLKKRIDAGPKHERKHQEEDNSAMKRDERDANLLINHVKKNMSDPLDADGEQTEVLINISTGRHAYSRSTGFTSELY